MEWVVLMLFALAVSAFIALPRRGDALANDANAELAELADERDNLLVALRELDEDVTAGRISAEDRLRGRRALGPRLREVTEALRDADLGGTSQR